MDPQGMPDDKFSSSGGLKASHLLIITAAAIIIGGLIFYYYRGAERRGFRPGPGEDVTDVPQGMRAATLYFAEKDNESLVAETRLVAIGSDLVEQMQQVVNALVDGPEESGVSTIAEGTRILDVFYDSEAAIIYIDFSSELVAGHPGGSSAEYFTIAAIIRTISENFPEVRAVQILIEGLQVGTIGGHIDAYKPFLVGDWR
jgi:spore germination protein GerM